MITASFTTWDVGGHKVWDPRPLNREYRSPKAIASFDCMVHTAFEFFIAG